MLLDPNTGLTSQDTMRVIGKIIDDNREDIDRLVQKIYDDYEVPEEVLDTLLEKKDLSPNEFRTLLRAIGEDYRYLTTDKPDEEYVQSCAKKIDDLRKVRAWMKANNKVVQNG